ncbi:MAG: GNAT family N-acetyltransferase [Clostridiales bacterium]|nr:GNAT family N-acetyltransferase [Clostridiales bacterium]
MGYIVEKYKNKVRFNEQYDEIYKFLKNNCDSGYNEHFHFGRFEWMMSHTMLDVDKLNEIGIFKDEEGDIVGIVTYDTGFDDNTYLLHSNNDKELLTKMIDFAIRNYSIKNKISIVANSKDKALIELLKENKFIETEWKDNVLELDLSKNLKYDLQKEYNISPKDFHYDSWKYQIVIHKGFDHDGIPEKLSDEYFKPTPNFNLSLKVFAIDKNNEYCAHCGIWYTEGDTAYIEPVVTIPKCRKKGLAKAVVYEAAIRARALGAKRAIVLSQQEFYYKIGFEKSSEFIHWDLQKKGMIINEN